MGKCGGRELNYVSDVDVIFVGRRRRGPGRRPACVAARLMEICGLVAWPVDAALRPEGSRGPLVRTLASHLAYYRSGPGPGSSRRCSRPARPPATSRSGQEWLDELQPLIWSAAERPEAVDDVRAMRRRIIDSVPPNELDREIKRGPGRAARHRVRGAAAAARARPRRRVAAGTRPPSPALRALVARRLRRPRPTARRCCAATASCAASSTACSCSACAAPTPCPTTTRRALRWLAARARLPRRRRAATPSSPSAPTGSRHAARGTPAARQAALPAAAGGGGPGAQRRAAAHPGGGPGPAGDPRLRRPGRRAAAHRGAHRRRVAAPPRSSAPCCRCCSSEFADAPEPDRGLLAYRQVSDKLGSTPWYLRLLRDEGPVALRLARLLGLSRYVADLLARDPEALRLLADDARAGAPRPAQSLCEGFAAAAARHADPARPPSARSARCAAGSCSGSPAPTCWAGPVGVAPVGAPLDVRRASARPVRRHRRHARRRAAGRPPAGRPGRAAVRHHRHGPARRRTR